MDIEKQREVIRLWNRMRKVEGPIAEEIRIQILEYLPSRSAPSARLDRPINSARCRAETPASRA